MSSQLVPSSSIGKRSIDVAPDIEALAVIPSRLEDERLGNAYHSK